MFLLLVIPVDPRRHVLPCFFVGKIDVCVCVFVCVCVCVCLFRLSFSLSFSLVCRGNVGLGTLTSFLYFVLVCPRSYYDVCLLWFVVVVEVS